MLRTPLGDLNVYINDKKIKYNLTNLPLKPIEVSHYQVDARYMIEIDKSQIKSGDIITFSIDTDMVAEIDGGDCLVEAMFESDDLYLALGGYDFNNGDRNNFVHFLKMILSLKLDYNTNLLIFK